MISDREGNFLITGGFNLTPVVRSIRTLSPVLRLAPCQSAVRVLSLNFDQRSVKWSYSLMSIMPTALGPITDRSEGAARGIIPYKHEGECLYDIGQSAGCVMRYKD